MHLGIRQRDLLKYLSGRNPVSYRELLVNGFGRRMLNRLAELGLVYSTGWAGQSRYTLTDAGSKRAGELWDEAGE